MEEEKVKAVIESILFAIGESVPIDRICEALEIDRKNAEIIMEKMQSEYENDQSRGIKILRLEDSFQLCTKTEYYGYIRTVAEKKSKVSLSNAALEVLSIVAYNQPVTRSSIEFIRGVNSDGSLSKLVELGLVEEKGRLDAPGRPILFGTTEEFLRCFGLTSLSSLPAVDNPNDIIIQQEFDIDSAQNGENTENTARENHADADGTETSEQNI
mgnify:CR=1 FL=1